MYTYTQWILPGCRVLACFAGLQVPGLCFSTGKCEEQNRASVSTAGTLACELHIPGSVSEIIPSVKLSWRPVMSTFAWEFSWLCAGESRGWGIWCQEEAALSPSPCVTTSSMQPDPAVSRNGSSLHFLLTLPCCRTRIVSPVTNLLL